MAKEYARISRVQLAGVSEAVLSKLPERKSVKQIEENRAIFFFFNFKIFREQHHHNVKIYCNVHTFFFRYHSSKKSSGKRTGVNQRWVFIGRGFISPLASSLISSKLYRIVTQDVLNKK